jgi:pimeloyl-ACP methyl ester carboxylesterase
VLFIMGATRDGGHFHGLADLLADEYTIVIYDRRGNGRSPRPRGWKTTSNHEQADDAAALLGSIGLAPAAVFGTSLGAIYALALLIRHPDAVRGAILHEPPLYGVLEHPEEVLAEVVPQLRAAMETGGAPALIERFWRWVAGDNGWEQLEPSLRQRMLATADTFCDIERGTYETYRPDDDTLTSITTPVVVLAGVHSPLFRLEIARWLAARLGVQVLPAPEPTPPTSITSAKAASRRVVDFEVDPRCQSPGVSSATS